VDDQLDGTEDQGQANDDEEAEVGQTEAADRQGADPLEG